MLTVQQLPAREELLAIIRDHVSHLTPEALLEENLVAFMGQILSVFDWPKPEYPNEDANAVHDKCVSILIAMGDYEKTMYGRELLHQQEDGRYDPVSHCMEVLTGFKLLPFICYTDLDRQVKKDLSEVIALIKRYESNEHVQLFLKGKTRPRHEFRTQTDFYKRCLQLRDDINQYLVEGMLRRTLEKAKSVDNVKKRTFMIALRDFPYARLWRIDRGAYDCELISRVKHRLAVDITDQERRQMEELYNRDKKVFYAKFLELQPAKVTFNVIQHYYLKLLPVFGKRAYIFEELFQLFENRSWIGFCSVALLQVEGIFSDMLKVAEPQQPYGSLSEKVLALQKHNGHRNANLDYYAYLLPVTRNMLVHTGNLADQDFELLAYDLLTDLSHILSVFEHVKHPHSYLHRIIRSNNNGYPFSQNEITTVLNLVHEVDVLRKKHKNDQALSKLWEMWEQFHSVGFWAEQWDDILPFWFEYVELMVTNTRVYLDDAIRQKGGHYTFDDAKSIIVQNKAEIAAIIAEMNESFLYDAYESWKSLYYMGHRAMYFPKAPSEQADKMRRFYEPFKEYFDKMDLFKENLKEYEKYM